MGRKFWIFRRFSGSHSRPRPRPRMSARQPYLNSDTEPQHRSLWRSHGSASVRTAWSRLVLPSHNSRHSPSQPVLLRRALTPRGSALTSLHCRCRVFQTRARVFISSSEFILGSQHMRALKGVDWNYCICNGVLQAGHLFHYLATCACRVISCGSVLGGAGGRRGC